MFDKEEIFNGDPSREKQKDAVPSPLLYLISLILDGGSILDDYNANSKIAAVNIGQLIGGIVIKETKTKIAILSV